MILTFIRYARSAKKMADKPSYSPDFFWPAPLEAQRGYRWVNGCLEAVPGAKFRDYEPELVDGLFLNFADLPATPDAFLDFANRYGLLGSGAVGPEGETLVAWQNAHKWFEVLGSLWLAARQDDSRLIDKYLRWEADFVHCPDLPVLPGVLSGKPLRLDRAALKKIDVTRSCKEDAAHVFVTEALNAARAAAAPHAWFLGTDDDGNRQLAWHYRIHSLFGAMVVQFTQAHTDHEDYVKCAACGRWFELEPGVNRADRITCSDACRQKLHRQRRSQVKRLYASGKSAEEIAAEVGSAIETVANWIKQFQAKEQ